VCLEAFASPRFFSAALFLARLRRGCLPLPDYLRTLRSIVEGNFFFHFFFFFFGGIGCLSSPFPSVSPSSSPSSSSSSSLYPVFHFFPFSSFPTHASAGKPSYGKVCPAHRPPRMPRRQRRKG